MFPCFLFVTGGDEHPTNNAIPSHGKNSLTNNSVSSIHSQTSMKKFTHTDSTSSLSTSRSYYSGSIPHSNPLPGITPSHQSAKTVSFHDVPPEEPYDDTVENGNFHRSPTPMPYNGGGVSPTDSDILVHSSANDKAIQAHPGSFIVSDTDSTDLIQPVATDTAGKQNGYRSRTPPPVSATPPPMDSSPTSGVREPQPLPPLSATPPGVDITHNGNHQ